MKPDGFRFNPALANVAPRMPRTPSAHRRRRFQAVRRAGRAPSGESCRRDQTQRRTRAWKWWKQWLAPTMRHAQKNVSWTPIECNVTWKCAVGSGFPLQAMFNTQTLHPTARYTWRYPGRHNREEQVMTLNRSRRGPLRLIPVALIALTYDYHAHGSWDPPLGWCPDDCQPIADRSLTGLNAGNHVNRSPGPSPKRDRRSLRPHAPCPPSHTLRSAASRPSTGWRSGRTFSIVASATRSPCPCVLAISTAGRIALTSSGKCPGKTACSRIALTAAETAPQCVCPSTTIKRYTQELHPVFQAGESVVVDEIAGDPYDEQIARALIERQFRRNARIRATDNRRNGILRRNSRRPASG